VLNLDTSSKVAGLLIQLQLDDLGVDYISRRTAMIDAVSLDDAKRVAKRLLDGGLLVTVVGKPEGVASSGTTAN
jgi:zinc protease